MICPFWRMYIMTYEWIKDNEHILTIRDRSTGWARQKRLWNHKVIEQVLAEQKPTEDIYITKYPKSRLVETLILDFDSEDDPKLAFRECKKLHNYLKINDINSVIVESGKKGNHLYIQIAPFKFKDTEYRQMSNWNSYFNAFVCFLIHDSISTYKTLDKTNFSAGLNGNIRLIGSKHPSTGNTCRIVKGSFKDIDSVPPLQDEAQRKAYLKMEIVAEEKKQRQLNKTRVVRGDDPILNNDLRDVFEHITGEVRRYPKGYAYCCCPVHSDSHPSLLVTKEWFSCSACSFKGNIWILKQMGLVEFDDNGEVLYR